MTIITPNNSPRKTEDENQLVRGERNLAAAEWIFLPTKQKVFESRSGVSTIVDEEGNTEIISIVVKYDPDLGTLVSFDRMIFLILIQLWNEQGQPDTCYFSMRELARRLGKKWNSDLRKAIKESLFRLCCVAIIWENSFFYVLDGKQITIEKPFSILSHLHFISTKDKGIRGQHGEFSFNRHVLENLKKHYTIPVLLDVYRDLSPLEGQVYLYLSRVHYATKYYHRTTSGFIQDIGLTHSYYQKLWVRNKELGKIGNALIGIKFPYGETLERYEIIKHKNKDSVLETSRTGAVKIKPDFERLPETTKRMATEVRTESAAPKAQKNAPEKPVERPKQASKPEQVVNHRETPSEPSERNSEVSQILGYFHEKSGSEIVSNPKIISTVNNLIAKHGVKFVRYMIDYAFVEAKKSGYHPQVFNGIKQYEKGALKSFKEFQRTEGLKKQQEDILRKKRLEDAKIDHERKYTEQYYHYIDELVDSLNQQYPEKFGEFLSWQETILEKEKENANGNTKLENIVTQHFNSQTQIVLRLRRHFEDDPEINIPMYWQWDELHNPHGWGKQKKAANS